MSRGTKAVAILAVTAMVVVASGAAALAAATPNQVTSAQAYGLGLRLDLLGTNVIPETHLMADSRVPNATTGDTDGASLIDFSQEPLIDELSALKTSVTRTDTTAHAEAHTAHAFLLQNGGVDLLKVDAVHSSADASCKDGVVTRTGDANLVGLFIEGQGQDIKVPPNTTIPLTSSDNKSGILITLNEQTPDADGHGMTVNALHIVIFELNTNIVFADIKVAHSHASAYCPGSPGGGTETPPATKPPVTISKSVTSTSSDANGDSDGLATAFPGDNVTWKITFKNNDAAKTCDLVRIIDTLPPHFSFVSSSGDLTTGATPDTSAPPDVIWDNPGGYVLDPGASLSETLVAHIAADTPPGWYTNLITVDNANCGTYSSGEVGAVHVLAKQQTAVKGKKVSLLPTEVPGGILPETGDNPASNPGFTPGELALASALLLGSGVGFRILKRQRSGS
jgi:uncharacterized repeat protein (TIGR01451 family)